MTNEQAKKYLENEGAACPFCGSEEMDSGRFKTDEGIAWRDVRCCECGKEWRDLYNLTGVKELKS